MIRWLREFWRESDRAESLKAYERREKVIGRTSRELVMQQAGFRDHQQITEELFCALMRPSLYKAKDAHPELEFAMEALPNGTMRIQGLAADKTVVREHSITLSELVDYNNGYDGGMRAFIQRVDKAVLTPSNKT